MGIDIIQNNIVFNPNHEKYVDTSIRTQHQLWNIKYGLNLCALLKRERTDDNLDGNPFIYALKQIRKHNTLYQIDRQNLYKILKIVNKNLDNALLNKQYDLIIPMPSSSIISLQLATRVGKKLHLGNKPVNLFAKRLNIDILSDFENVNINTLVSNRRQANKLKQALRKLKPNPNGKFVLKEVDRHIRKYFMPMIIINPVIIKNVNNVLIVDDTVSSGHTLHTAIQLLKQINPQISVEALTLLGSIH